MITGAHWHTRCKCGRVWSCVIRRHDVVVDILAEAGRELEWDVEKELGGLYLDSKGRPADILFPRPTAAALPRAVDVVVCDPRSESAMKANPDKTPLAAAALKERKKMADHLKRLALLGPGIVSFDKVAFAIESSGAWGKVALDLWKNMKGRAKEIKLENYVRSNSGLLSRLVRWCLRRFLSPWPNGRLRLCFVGCRFLGWFEFFSGGSCDCVLGFSSFLFFLGYSCFPVHTSSEVDIY